MKTKEALKSILDRIDRKGYKSYRGLVGAYEFNDFQLHIDHVQSDPFASPSRLRVCVPSSGALFPVDTCNNRSRETGLRDFLSRQFNGLSRRVSRAGRGTGKSGLVTMVRTGQEILERTSVLVRSDYIEARFVAGLPARGRSVLGNVARDMLLREIPFIVRETLFFDRLDRKSLYSHIETAEDADYLREQLPRLGLISFIADGAALPRATGIDNRPLTEGRVVPFCSPESMSFKIDLPNRGTVSGMGIQEGITLIAGGGYHGKSTLLDAIKYGVYNHVPGDGRELVITVPDAVMVRAEDGRRIEGVDISPFISNLPFGKGTEDFRTDNASGSTSQAANIMEAVETGASAVLIDEDRSATNFMIRDFRMQELVAKDLEPITPYIDKVRQLFHEHNVSTVLVIGGAGDYFDVADHVLMMKEYAPEDCTVEAKKIAGKYLSQRRCEGGDGFGSLHSRIPDYRSVNPRKGKRDVKISARNVHAIAFGQFDIELDAVEQIVDEGQTRSIGDAIYYAVRYMDGTKSLDEILGLVLRDIRETGLDVLSTNRMGDYAMFRKHELAAAMNRLRSLRMK